MCGITNSTRSSPAPGARTTQGPVGLPPGGGGFYACTSVCARTCLPQATSWKWEVPESQGAWAEAGARVRKVTSAGGFWWPQLSGGGLPRSGCRTGVVFEAAGRVRSPWGTPGKGESKAGEQGSNGSRAESPAQHCPPTTQGGPTAGAAR